ncbi:MAG: cbb3-type cytochrome c oxidase subunit 3 [Pseudomonadota bacterium]|nr:MAG: cbb3-type cytochrome c oxidase subunit 3 [Pseudomonadota bacterium]
MDINDIRAWYTVIMFAVFAGIVWWAWSGKQKRRFHEAARLPFNEPEHPRSDDAPRATQEASHE